MITYRKTPHCVITLAKDDCIGLTSGLRKAMILLQEALDDARPEEVDQLVYERGLINELLIAVNTRPNP
jgi:hypothetical protein